VTPGWEQDGAGEVMPGWEQDGAGEVTPGWEQDGAGEVTPGWEQDGAGEVMPGWEQDLRVGEATMMFDKFITYIRQYNLLQPGEHVLIAVSGGLDSTVLLHLVNRLAREWPLRLSAAHFNHQLRGAAADGDEQFVRDLCVSWGIPFESGRGDVRSHASEHHLSQEAAARELRYAFLRELAERSDCGAIATAHHAGDQAETLLDRLIRGAGVRGLAGIVQMSKIGNTGVNLIRPLLFASRFEIGEYAEKNALVFRNDATNLDLRIRRNRIRHELLPQLAKYNPQIVSALAGTAAHLREAEEYISSEARAGLRRCLSHCDCEKITLEKEPFLSYFTLLQKYILQEAWQLLGGDLRIFDSDLWIALENFIAAGRSDRGFPLGSGELWLTGRHLVLLGIKSRQEETKIARGPGIYPLWSGYSLEIKAVSASLEEAENNADLKSAFIDASLLHSDLSVRTPRAGDRFQPLGMKGSKKVADLLAEAGVPVYERKRIPILVSGDAVVWLCGIRLSHLFRITSVTTNAYQLKVNRSLDPAL
jgi:tRNA(Ile)-lysidine synthase